MLLIAEITAGVAAGVVIGFFILANWASILNSAEKLLAIAGLIAIFAGACYGLAWVVDTHSMHSAPTADELNVTAGNIAMYVGGLLGLGLITFYFVQLGRFCAKAVRFLRSRLSRLRGGHDVGSRPV